MTQDYNKGISLIEYNSLNLAKIIQMKNGNSIYYSYDALGRKHGKRIVTLKAAVNVPMGEVYTANADEIKVNRRMYYCGNHIYAGLAKLSLFKTFVPDGYLEGNGEWFYQIKDHLRNVRAEVDRGGVQYTTNYYPSGIQHGGHGLSADYAFGSKELQSSHGVNLYDFEARYYDPIFGFTTMDPLCEKYYGVSPYSYCAGNSVNAVDLRGDSITVAAKYRDQFMTDMQKVFGDKASSLSFNANGNLVLNSKTKEFTEDMSKEQKKAFAGLKGAMSDEQITSVVYANNYNLTIEGKSKLVNVVDEFGGRVYSKIDNLIVISPNAGTVNVTLDQMGFTNGTLNFSIENVQQNTTSVLFHELGERNTANISFRGSVIDYENYARKTIGLPLRPFDLNHSKKIKTNYK